MTKKSPLHDFKIKLPFFEYGMQGEFELKSKLTITHPEEEQVTEEYVSLFGTGCSRGWKVLTVNWLIENRCYLNDGEATPDSNGDWVIKKCHLRASSERFIYAISVRKADVKLVKELFEKNRIKEISDLEELLQSSKIRYKLSSRKRLVRIVQK